MTARGGSFLGAILAIVACASCGKPGFPSAAGANPVPAVTPRGSSTADAFAELEPRGIYVIVDWKRMATMVSAELRFKPVDGRRLVEAVAAAKGMKVAWMRGERGEIALFYWAQPDAELAEFARELDSPNAAVRAEAVEKAGWMGDVRVIPTLVAAASSADEKVASGILRSLCRRPWAPILADASAREAAWKLGEQILATCSEKDFDNPYSRGCRVIEGMTAYGGERAVANVRKTLARKEPSARRAALEGLCRLVGAAALPDVGKALADEDPRVAGMAFEMLGRIRGPKAVEQLETALGAKDAVVRQGALAGLAWLGGEKAAVLIGRALADPDEEVRKTVVASLQRVGGEAAVGLLEKMLADKEKHVAWPAARALGGVGGEEIVPALEKKLVGADSLARQLALVSLGEIGSPKAVDLLEAALADADPAVRKNAVAGLAVAGGKRVLGILLKHASQEKDPGVRASMVYPVTRCGADYFPLEAALAKDSDTVVRLACTYAAHNYGCGGKVLDLKARMFKDPSGQVRQAAPEGWPSGLASYRRFREVTLAAIETELDPMALDEQLACLGGWRDAKARDIMIRRLQTEKDPEKIKALGIGMRRMMQGDPQIARLLRDLNVPPEMIHPGQQRK